ncbi:hypothetical protein ACHAWC_001772 [Mediolabrus comicus]
MMNILFRRIAIILLLLIAGTVSQASGTDGPTPVVSVATIKYSNGDYRGNIDDNGLRNGHGKYAWTDGSVYEGDWLADKMHGKGKFTWANGDVYDGEFQDNSRNGKGKYTYAHGDVYDGEFLDDLRSGKGKYTWADGRVYDGDFLADKRHGKGKYTWSDGRVYDGEFQDDLFHGKGKYTGMWKVRRYQGEWINDKINGKGVMSLFGNLIEVKGEWKGGWLTSIVRVRVDTGVLALANRLVHVICSYHYFGFHHVLVLAVWTILWEFLLRDLKGAKSNKEPTDGVGVVHVERDGTDDTDRLVVGLDRDYSHCGICYEAFTTDMERTDHTSRKLLPVMGSCGHYFCRGCIIASQYMVAPNGAMGCPKCNRADRFDPEDLVPNRMLIDLLTRARPLNDFLNRARHIGTAPADEEA